METLLNIPRIVIGAPQGRSGKTTVTMGLLAALSARGLGVQPFKKGPDFIDPGWLSKVAGRPCRNLDAFFMSREALRYCLAKGSRGADIAVVEGAMGLFDGVDLQGSGSTAEIAKALESPVLLVVNAVRMTRSIAAIVLGCQNFDPEVNIRGVILNNVARPRHEKMLRAAVETYCGLPVVGTLPKNKAWEIPDRHLGLIPAGEDERLFRAVEAARGSAEKYIDIDSVLEIARSAPPLPWKQVVPKAVGRIKRRVRVGVFRDRAFSFYYPENLEALEDAGAHLVFIDALSDALPDVDALYIGGGFPEVFAAELQANKTLREAVLRKIEEGMPVYAECGGLMYLARSLLYNGKRYAMAGALPFDVEMGTEPRGHGYMRLKVLRGNPYFTPGKQIRGHEFHHSSVSSLPDGAVFGYEVERGYGINGSVDGFVYKNTMASYCHLHALAVPEWAPVFVAKAFSYRSVQEKKLKGAVPLGSGR
ncbi:MAG: cobyrinate a,c-diamide synthase [Bacillota bacterium]